MLLGEGVCADIQLSKGFKARYGDPVVLVAADVTEGQGKRGGVAKRPDRTYKVQVCSVRRGRKTLVIAKRDYCFIVTGDRHVARGYREVLAGAVQVQEQGMHAL